MTRPFNTLVWCLIDNRTGKRVSVAVYTSQRRAELAVLSYRDRQRNGGRPDLSHADCQALRVVRRSVVPERRGK